MYRLLFHGSNSKCFSRLRASLPSSIDLRMVADRDHLPGHLDDGSVHGLVLAFTSNRPGPEDLAYLRSIVGLPRVPSVVVLGKQVSNSQVSCCMRYGAYDCLPEEVSGEVLGRILVRMINDRYPAASSEFGILGDGAPITNLRKQIRNFANYDYKVLILGETGTGKELVARSLHEQSPRRENLFVTVNCASYSDDMLLSELFGSIRGAFTGSVNRAGLLESAGNGTVFLDEIGELSLRSQASLLRVVDHNHVRRLGSNEVLTFNARIVAATNRDLAASVRNGSFRNDLYQRLDRLRIETPALREHLEDVPLLARAYLGSLPRGPMRIDNSAIAALVDYDWPGNVRELQSVLLKASVDADSRIITLKNLSLPSLVRGNQSSPPTALG